MTRFIVDKESLKQDVLKTVLTELDTDQLIDVAVTVGMEINRRRAEVLGDYAGRSALCDSDLKKIAYGGVRVWELSWEDYCRVTQFIDVLKAKVGQGLWYQEKWPILKTNPPKEYRRLFGLH